MLRENEQEEADSKPSGEAGGGLEAARALQSRIGNKAMQRLLELDEKRPSRDAPAAPGNSSDAPLEEAPKEKAALPGGEANLSPPRPEQDGRSQPPRDLTELAAEESDRPAEEVAQPLARETAPDKTSMVAEEQLAAALQPFLAVLGRGSGGSRWEALDAAFLEADNPAQQKALSLLTERVQQLEETPKKAFMEKLSFRQRQGSRLASLLGTRLALLNRGDTAPELPAEGDG